MIYMKKIFIIIALFIVILGVIAIVRFWTPEDTWLCQNGIWVKHGNPDQSQPTGTCAAAPSASASPRACTEEAKICPDGSAVGRIGPNCEFAPCPSVASCAGGPCPSGSSILPYDSGVEGTVLLGPTCPVMRVGDTTCADKPYATTVQVILLKSPKSSTFATAQSDKEGKYKIMLPPGDYALQPLGGAPLPRCETKNITIEPGKIIQVDLNCDTGIR